MLPIQERMTSSTILAHLQRASVLSELLSSSIGQGSKISSQEASHLKAVASEMDSLLATLGTDADHIEKIITSQSQELENEFRQHLDADAFLAPMKQQLLSKINAHQGVIAFVKKGLLELKAGIGPVREELAHTMSDVIGGRPPRPVPLLRLRCALLAAAIGIALGLGLWGVALILFGTSAAAGCWG